MKTKFLTISTLFLIFVVLLGCVSTPTPVPTTPQIERPVAIDWQGAIYGTQIPEWARIALEGNAYDSLSKMSEFNGKIIKVASNRGQDLDLLKAWVQSDAADSISRGISQTVTSKLGSYVDGNKDKNAGVKIATQAIGIFSSTTISGFEKAKEFWVKMKNPNGTTELEYVVLYTIADERFNEQIEKALGNIKAETEEEQNALKEIKNLVMVSATKATTVEN